MVTKVVSAKEIPNWEMGDVAIKTYSYGASLELSEMMGERIEVEDGEKVKKIFVKEGYKESDVNLFALAAGILWIKKKDESTFIIDGTTEMDDKKTIIYDIDLLSAKHLLIIIRDLNKPFTEEQKKN